MRCFFLLLLLARAPVPAQARHARRPHRRHGEQGGDHLSRSSRRGRLPPSASCARQGTPPPERAVLERQMLERLILDKAQLQMARDTGIRIDELQLDRAVQRIAESNKMTLADFRSALERDGVAFDACARTCASRSSCAAARARGRRQDPGERQRDRPFPRADEGARPARAEYNIAHILVRVPEQASPERSRRRAPRAEKALAEARGGGDFARVAASYSDAPDALQGGALGWRSARAAARAFRRGAAEHEAGRGQRDAAQPGGLPHPQAERPARRGRASAPVRADARAPYPRAHQRNGLGERGAAPARRPARAHRRRAAPISPSSRACIRTTRTAARGGELDWVYPGDTVPDFERAYQELQARRDQPAGAGRPSAIT